ncbi:MAG: methyltransferase domain-containing protein [Maribacter sp.]|nr:methyltransferase domain-containing protein [Maribacter sp.]MBT8313837.1 methyltransferase domain-containing protein [Maribacter sp.]
MMINFKERSNQKEFLDDFQGDSHELAAVLNDINRVNRILGGNRITANAVFRLIEERPKDSYTILDMGCGEGEMLRALAILARKKNISLKLTGIDLNSDALKIAKQASLEFPELTFLEKDVLSADFSDYNCDIVITTLTMHHFQDSDILNFAQQFTRLASIGVVINDLQRNALAYYLFKVFSLIFIKTKVAKQDGLTSIRRGFRKSELIALSSSLSDIHHEISWKWAFRYVWIMRK